MHFQEFKMLLMISVSQEVAKILEIKLTGSSDPSIQSYAISCPSNC